MVKQIFNSQTVILFGGRRGQMEEQMIFIFMVTLFTRMVDT